MVSSWEKRLVKSGIDIITWEHDDIVDYLLAIFERDKAQLLLEATSIDTRAREVPLVLDHENIFGVGKTNFGGTIVYNKKKCKFTHIIYSDRHNYAVMFSVDTKVAFFAREFYMQMKKVFPFGCSNKRLKEYLMAN